MSTLAAMPSKAARRVVFLGTPEVAVPPLKALVAAGVEVALVITRPDKRRGRGSGVSPSPVKVAAEQMGIAVSHQLSDVLTAGAELGVVVAYGRIIPVGVLQQLPMVNVHFSLLPRWRGAAPVERALLAGDRETGVCIMRVEEDLDTGDVYARVVVPIRDDHTLGSLRQELVEASLEPLLRVVTGGFGVGEPQTGEAVHAAKIDPTELRIDWRHSATQILAQTKLETAWFEFRGKRVKLLRARPPRALEHASGQAVHSFADAQASNAGEVLAVSSDGVVVACGDGAVVMETVQPEGKSAMSASAWANGARLADTTQRASLA